MRNSKKKNCKQRIFTKNEFFKMFKKDVEKEVNRGLVECQYEAVYILLDKFNFTPKRIDRFLNEIDNLMDKIIGDKSLSIKEYFSWVISHGFSYKITSVPDFHDKMTQGYINRIVCAEKMNRKYIVYVFIYHVLRFNFRLTIKDLWRFKYELENLSDSIDSKFISYSDIEKEILGKYNAMCFDRKTFKNTDLA